MLDVEKLVRGTLMQFEGINFSMDRAQEEQRAVEMAEYQKMRSRKLLC
jgi:hypothetical protein